MVPAVILLSGCCQGEAASVEELRHMVREGDLIFQQSQSSQSEAIRQATGSAWTHVGVVVRSKAKLRVLEAAGKGVAETSLEDFVARSRDGRIAVLRLKGARERFTPEAMRRFEASLKGDTGKRYDGLFEWSDERIYCSELVWRAYEKAFGISVGEVQLVGDLAYERPAVQALIESRFRGKAKGARREDLLKEKIITPVAMKESDLLEVVFEGRVKG